MSKKSWIVFTLLLCCAGLFAGTAEAQTDKPNILVIWGDDIGIFNISAYSHGMMGYQTPNIDRIAREGAIFTDFYAEQSCTAGAPRSSPVRSPSAPACPRWACPVPSRGSASRTRLWRSC